MKTVIWKYELLLRDTQLVEMPKSAKLLHVAVQRGVPCLWVEAACDSAHILERRIISIAGTGQPFHRNADDRHIGTFMLEGGNLVFHVFGQ